MKTAPYILVIVHFISEIGSFSYNTRSKIIFTPSSEGNDHSYFGYSTLLKKDKNPYIVVGAPRDDSNYINHKDIKEPGTVYLCKINFNETQTTCNQKIVDKNGNTLVQVANGGNYKHGKDNMWMGMSMVGSENGNEMTVICAPRWVNKISSKEYFMNGMCYPVNNFMEDSNKTDQDELLPLVESSNQGFNIIGENNRSNQILNFYAYGQAGFSSALSDDGKELLLGAPGILHWAGSAVKYFTDEKHSDDMFTNFIIPNPYYTPQINQDSYLGYSVGIGKFVTGKDNLYVAGAPRGSNCKGQVLIFDFPSENNGKIDIIATLNGSQMGEYFGSTVTAIDLNKDNLTDLIIGAPTYSNKLLQDVGRIYVYINNDKGNFILQNNIICGNTESRARFGSTISSIGDINQDGYLDIAVGAPYENNGKGAIYIYLGAVGGLSDKYVQRISMNSMFGFGISISKGVDIDNNLCNDIAVGAHDSGAVVLLRCHPSVQVNPKITSNPKQLLPAHTDFIAKICFQFEGSEHRTDLELNLLIDPEYKRAQLNNSKETTFYLSGSNGREDCKEILINLKEKVVDYSRPIELHLTYKLKKNPLIEKEFCANCTLLRPGRNNTEIFMIPFSVGCGSDSICSPDLQLKVETSIKSTFIIGSASNISLNISLQNFGEPAFLPRTEFVIPKSTPLLQIPSQCYTIEFILICDFGTPLALNSKESILIKLDATHLKNSDKSLEFHVIANSAGQEIHPENNNVTINVILKSIAEVEIVGKTTFPEYIYINSKSETPKTILEKHYYEVINNGPSLLDTITIRFFLPLSWQNKISGKIYEIMKVLSPKAILDQQLLNCVAKSESFYEIEKDINASGFNYNSHLETILNQNSNKLTTYLDYLPIDIQDEEYPNSIHINCTDKEYVTCLIVECSGSRLIPGTNGAQIYFETLLNKLNIQLVMNNKQSVIISSYATIQSEYISGSGVQSAWAKSLLVGEIPKPPATPWWIYLLSILLGVLLLIIITYVLYKRGFFRRKMKEEIKLLEMEDENCES